MEKISPRGLTVIRQRGFSLLTTNSGSTEERHCPLQQKIINNLKFVRNTYEHIFTVTQERLQKASVLLRISQISPLFGVRTLQNILHLTKIVE